MMPVFGTVSMDVLVVLIIMFAFIALIGLLAYFATMLYKMMIGEDPPDHLKNAMNPGSMAGEAMKTMFGMGKLELEDFLSWKIKREKERDGKDDSV